MVTPSRREQAAFEVVRRVLGAEVEHHDTAGRQGAVDALIAYDDGTRAALEVTTLTEGAAHEVEALLAAEDFTWTLAECSWWWTVEVPPGTSVRRLRARLHELARWCEQRGITDPARRARFEGLDGEQWGRWLTELQVSVRGHREAGGAAGTAMVTPAGNGGMIGDLDTVPGWLAEELQSERTRRKVEKLLASGMVETHLFLVVDTTGAPFPWFYALAFNPGLPVDPPNLGGLTAVWLAPRWSEAVLRYDCRSGWSRHHPFDPDAAQN